MISRGELHAGIAPSTNEIARARMTETAVIMTGAGAEKPGIRARAAAAEDIGTTGEAEAGGNGGGQLHYVLGKFLRWPPFFRYLGQIWMDCRC